MRLIQHAAKIAREASNRAERVTRRGRGVGTADVRLIYDLKGFCRIIGAHSYNATATSCGLCPVQGNFRGCAGIAIYCACRLVDGHDHGWGRGGRFSSKMTKRSDKIFLLFFAFCLVYSREKANGSGLCAVSPPVAQQLMHYVWGGAVGFNRIFVR